MSREDKNELIVLKKIVGVIKIIVATKWTIKRLLGNLMRSKIKIFCIQLSFSEYFLLNEGVRV